MQSSCCQREHEPFPSIGCSHHQAQWPHFVMEEEARLPVPKIKIRHYDHDSTLQLLHSFLYIHVPSHQAIHGHQFIYPDR